MITNRSNHMPTLMRMEIGSSARGLVRTRALLPISILINVGMWFERFVIIVTSLHRSYLPSSWVMYYPTAIEIGTLIGSFGLFFTCFLFFIRLLPMIATWEVKSLAGTAAVAEAHGIRV